MDMRELPFEDKADLTELLMHLYGNDAYRPWLYRTETSVRAGLLAMKGFPAEVKLQVDEMALSLSR